MSSAFAIKDWETKFSNADAKARMVWRWVPLPISLTGERYRKLMRTSQGREAFSVFVSLCEVAANMPTRGILRDERGALKPTTISVKTGIPVRVVERAIITLASAEIGWLVSVPHPDSIRAASGPHPGYPTPPNPTIPDQTKTQEPAAPIPTAAGCASVPIGTGGIGKERGRDGRLPVEHGVDAFHGTSDGSGGSGGPLELRMPQAGGKSRLPEAPIAWTPTSLERFLRVCQVHPKTAAELAPHAGRLDGINLAAEWKRIIADPMRKDKQGTLVGWIEKAAGINRGSVATIIQGLKLGGGAA